MATDLIINATPFEVRIALVEYGNLVEFYLERPTEKSLVGNVDAVFIPTDNTVVSALESAIKVCEQNKLPLFNADVDSVKRGSIAAMGFDYYQHGYQTGALAQRIMQGADPATTAVEFQEKLQLHINASAAQKMGVAIPAALRTKADMIYE